MTSTTTEPYSDLLERHAGHTPGPWKARGYRVEGDGQVVAGTEIMRRADIDAGVAEGEANARPMILRYHGPGDHCPGCGRCHWLIGRQTAECAFCSTALPLADSSSRTARIISTGKGGGKVARMAA